VRRFRQPFDFVVRLALVLLCLPAIAAPPPAYIPPNAIQPAIEALTSREMAGRMSGERGNELAAQYIVAGFQKAGLRPLGTARSRDSSARLDGSGYFQPFTFRLGQKKGTRNRMSVAVGGRVRRLRPVRDFDPIPISASGRASGAAVFVGCGMVSTDPKQDDFAGADLSGKVAVALACTRQDGALVPSKLLTRKASAARERGAVALVVITGRHQESPEMLRHTLGQPSASIPVLMLRRSTAARLLAQADLRLDDLERRAAAGPCPTACALTFDLEADLRPYTCLTANVAGLLQGSDPVLRDEVIVAGAHLDHLGRGVVGTLPDDYSSEVHPGADDNASGCAGVLALARYFAALPEKPRRSLLFVCFSGEEEGLYGSGHYMAHPLSPRERTVAMLNLDMVGRIQNNHIAINGTGTSPAWRPLLAELNRTASFNIGYFDGVGSGSDHEPFAAHKIPVLFFFSGMHRDYHRASDTADKINQLDQARIVSLAADILTRLAADPQRIAWSDPPGTRTAGSRPALPVYLGIRPEYAQSGVAGVRVAAVPGGGPAALAGLHVGDTITKLGDRALRGLDDYMAALAGHKPGDSVAVTVRRGDSTIALTATLAEPR